MRDVLVMIRRTGWRSAVLAPLAVVAALALVSGCAKPEPLQEPAAAMPEAAPEAAPAAAPAPGAAAIGASVGTRPLAPVPLQAPAALTPEQRLSLKRAFDAQAAQQITPQNAEAAAEALEREIDADKPE